MYYLDVAVPVALSQTFTYTSETVLLTGIRVKVSFGRRKLVGVVLAVSRELPKSDMELKAVDEIIDPLPVYSESMLSLACWLSTYYLHPIGEVLRSMLPVSLVKKEKIQFRLTELGGEVREDEARSSQALIRFLWTRRMPYSQKSLKAKLAKWQEDTGAKLTLKKLEKDGLIVKESIDKTHGRSSLWSDMAIGHAEALVPNLAPELTPDQVSVTNRIIEGGFESAESRKAYLLHGVTGAGKTEVYLQLISEALSRNPANQVMVLVPEIALTPQMTRVFSARFPGQVAVVHSAMAPAERWAELQSVRNNQRQILIGPRSAVFAAFDRLCLLIVDEEHDSSYKQTTGLTYNGRDVAVMRAHLEGRPVVLGSATPSMESYANAIQGKYQLLELMERANRKPMPDIQFITTDVQKGFARKLSGSGRQRAMPVIDLPIDERILEALRANLAEGKQSMVLVNRRGYAYYLFSIRDRKAVACPNCSISLTVHEKSTLLRCHYCDFQKAVDKMIPPDAADSYVLVGYGSEQMEYFLKEGIPGARIQRVDSDSVGQRDTLPSILDRFREGEIDVLVGTQMLAKGHDFAKVTLICILEIDQTLNLPDFRAGERTFQLMVQAAGRAGRGEWSGHVMIQTQRADHPVLKAGLKQSYSEFWEDQLEFRRAHNYPPFSRMIVFEFTSSKRDKLVKWVGEVEQWIIQRMKTSEGRYRQLSIMGPSIPPLETIRGRSRRTLLLMGSDRRQLWAFAKEVMETFHSPAGDLRLRVDVDPQSLM